MVVQLGQGSRCVSGRKQRAADIVVGASISRGAGGARVIAVENAVEQISFVLVRVGARGLLLLLLLRLRLRLGLRLRLRLRLRLWLRKTFQRPFPS